MNRIILNSLIVILLVLVMGLVVFVSGCNQPNSSSELQRLKQPVSQFAQQWIEKYGEGVESVKNYNLILTQQIVNKQGQVVGEINKTLEARIKALEDKVAELEESHVYVPNYIEDCTNPAPCNIRHDIRPEPQDPNDITEYRDDR